MSSAKRWLLTGDCSVATDGKKVNARSGNRPHSHSIPNQAQYLLAIVIAELPVVRYSPRRLTFTWWGCYGLCLTLTNRACPLLSILFLCLFLSMWPFQLYFIPSILPTTLRFLTLFFRTYLCLIGPFNYIFLYESILHPDIIASGLIGLKTPITN